MGSHLRKSGKLLWRGSPWIALLLLALPALLISGARAEPFGYSFTHTGDYLTDAFASINELLEGNLLGIYSTDPLPLMTPLSIVVRAIVLVPFSLVGALDSGFAPFIERGQGLGEYISSYYWGSLGLLLVAAAIWLVSCKGLFEWMQARWKPIGGIIAVGFLLFNPVINYSITWGHPEEILMAALITAAFLLVNRDRYSLAAVALALAVLTKQPAVFFAPLLFFAVPAAARIKLIGVFVGTVLVGLAPFVIPHFSDFIAQQFTASTAGGVTGTHGYGTSVFDLFGGVEDWGWASRVSIAAVAVGLPLVLVRGKASARIAAEWVLPAAALIAIARCWFDPYNIIYYAAPWALLMGAIELRQYQTGKHPFQRKWPNIPVPIPVIAVLASVAYATVTSSNGWAANHISNAFENEAITTALIVAPITAWLVWLLLPKKPALRFRVVAAAGTAYLLLIAFTAVVSSFREAAPVEPTVNSSEIEGYQLLPEEEIASRIAPDRVYRLDPKSSTIGLPARFTGVKSSPVSLSGGTSSFSLFDYGPPDDGLQGASVVTFLPGTFKADQRRFEQCVRKDVCPDGFKVKDTALSELTIVNSNPKEPNAPVEISALVGDQMVYVIVIGSAYPWKEVLKLVEPVPLAGAE